MIITTAINLKVPTTGWEDGFRTGCVAFFVVVLGPHQLWRQGQVVSVGPVLVVHAGRRCLPTPPAVGWSSNA